MNISLDNYEQYFSMYVDNELSAADRAQVESFLQAHPYLQEEMEMLQQTILVPEDISFFDKSSLLKPVLNEEMERKLLFHLDKELPAAEAAALDKKINSEPFLQKEWALLQKTKLDAGETIEFPYKKDLYRKEEARVIRMPWMKWAAAAAVVGFGFYFAFNLMNPQGNNIDNGLAKVDSVQPGGTKTATAQHNTENVNDAQKENNAVTNDSNDPLNYQNMAANNLLKEQETKEENRINNKKEVLENTARVKENMTANLAPKKQGIGNKVETVEPVNKNEAYLPSNEIAALQPKKLNNAIESPELTQAPTIRKEVIDEEIHPGRSGYAQTASLNFEESDNSVFLLDEENISRSKAGILLKKLKRNVERRANIKPGKSIRIAGFEFAAK